MNGRITITTDIPAAFPVLGNLMVLRFDNKVACSY